MLGVLEPLALGPPLSDGSPSPDGEPSLDGEPLPDGEASPDGEALADAGALTDAEALGEGRVEGRSCIITRMTRSLIPGSSVTLIGTGLMKPDAVTVVFTTAGPVARSGIVVTPSFDSA